MSGPLLLAIGTYRDWDVAAMQEGYSLYRLSTPDEISGLAASVREEVRAVAYAGHRPFGPAQMDQLPALRIIANYGVGYDAIDVAAATARGIRVTNTPDVLNDDVADLTVAMMLAFSRNLVANAAHLARGDWPKGDPPLARKMSGQRAGIVGLGRIGREIADRLAAFKMDIHYHARAPKDVPDGWTYHADPGDLAAQSDWLIVALVGGEATRGYVSRSVIDRLGPDAVIVNISRGTTIDEDAMLDALDSGRIRGAALDVFLNEPKIDPRFLALPNVLLQPHQGSATIETRKGMGELQRANIAAHFDGRPLPTPVN